MKKKILITGATDGIGLETAKMLVTVGHDLLLHGRNREKLTAIESKLTSIPTKGRIETFVADFSRMKDVTALADAIAQSHTSLDVLINNAGIYAPGSTTADGIDIRFAVNTFAPLLLTRRLMPLLGTSARIVNLSSAAQSGVDPNAFVGRAFLPDGAAYAQSKLALTMWSYALAHTFGADGPAVIAVNPGSMLGSKMVKDAFGVEGGDLRVGADVLTRAALSDEFADASGKYFDNDAGRFASPHSDAIDLVKSKKILQAMEDFLVDYLG